MGNVSRRGFLKGAALATAGVAAASVVGCSSGESSSAEAGSNISWDEEFDIVIVGSGLAGASAAAAVALEGSGETCLLLEKSPSALGGGNSPFSGGSVVITDEEHLDGCKEYFRELCGSYDTTPDEVLDIYAEYVATNLDFIDRLGANASDYTVYAPGEWHLPEPITSGSGCWPEYPEIEAAKNTGRLIFTGEEISTVSKFMLTAVEAHSDVITHKLNAPATSLVQDPETGTILGVVYEDGSKEKRAKANKGVIMCCGGFENNKAMLQDYLSVTNAHPLAGEYNTGDGFPMCLNVGADLWHMNSCAGFWTGAEKLDGSSHTPYGALGKKSGITVGTHGRRFYHDVDFGVGLDWVTTTSGDPDLRTAVGSRHGHQNIGGEWPHQWLPETAWFIFDSAHKDLALGGLAAEAAASSTALGGAATTTSAFTEDPEADGWGSG